MAGTKKKKKPAANPARGFATTSIASKPRPEAADTDAGASATQSTNIPLSSKQSGASSTTPTSTANGHQQQQVTNREPQVELSPEEFEKQLDESELQLLVEKHAHKVKRDAQRQKSRLDTERRLWRGQADTVNSIKWLPQDLMDYILDLIRAENHFSSSALSSEENPNSKMPSEEDMIVRLWTLRQTLAAAEFPHERVQAAIQHILDIGSSISAPAKDFIWGLEEALDWLARKCQPDELPAYDAKPKVVIKETPVPSPLPTRSNTPRPPEGQKGQLKKGGPKHTSLSKKLVVTCSSDFEADDLIPEYLTSKKRLLEFERKIRSDDTSSDNGELAIAKLEARIRKIESDVLFDRSLAESQWRIRKIELEKEFAAAKKQEKINVKSASTLADKENVPKDAEGDVNDEAERLAAEILAQNGEDDDDDDGFGGLFDSLPQNEVDATTGESQTIVRSANGVKIRIRDFGKWVGSSPRRILEEACRSRDSSAKINYTLLSEASFANRHGIEVLWSKPQELPTPINSSDVEATSEPFRVTLMMTEIATPNAGQSEACAATYTLFYIFSSNSREEKVGMKLPPIWRDLWSELAEARKEKIDAQDREIARELRSMIRLRQDQELEDGVILPGAFKARGNLKGSEASGDGGSAERPRPSNLNGDIFREIWANKTNSLKYQTMLQSRMQLPMWGFKEQVIQAVEQNQIVIICGETGCGKSTQVPAFLLEHELCHGRSCKIYCTEPRRISAISLARRVSEELGENKSDLGTNRSLVGYSIRLEANTSKETRLVYATTGIVMRMLEGSNDLREVTHLVLDEVHERSIDSDFLLIVLKRLLHDRRDLKVVLMSATVDAERFSKYLGGAPVLNVPGRTFPVQVRYLEDAVELTHYTPIVEGPAAKMEGLDEEIAEPDTSSPTPKSDFSKTLVNYSPSTKSALAQIDEYRIEFDLVVQLIVKIATSEDLISYSKAILVFLPGIAEIRTLNDALLGDPRFAKDWLIYPLHSTIATEDQESAFLIPPRGMRKIVLATNIAETGITIPDVTCVIDTGKHREMRFDERRQLSRLIDTFISRANAKQRRGRAGRVQQGLCFHMFTKYRHDSLMSDQQTPEMLRLSLQDLAIRVKICKLGGIEDTLGDALDAPAAKNIRRAIDALIDVRALTTAEDLTPLGYQLARLPLDVFLGKLVLFGTIFKCLDAALTIAAILSVKSPFQAPFGQRAQAQNALMLFHRGDSDLLTIYNAYLAWKRVCLSNTGGSKDFQFCRKNFLSQQTLSNIEDVKGQLLVSLADSGFLSLTEEERRGLNKMRFGGGRRRQQHFFEVPQRVSVNSDNDVVTASVIAWSFYPRLLVRDTPGTKGLRNVGNNQSISLHPSSVNRSFLDTKWLSYYRILHTKSVYHAHETTAVEPFAIALLCGDARFDMYAGLITLDGNRGRFVMPDWKTMLIMKVLRTRLKELLTRSFKQPGKLPTQQQEKWLEVWQKLFSQDVVAGKVTTIKS